MKGTIVSRIDMLARMNKKYEYRFCDEFGIKLAFSHALEWGINFNICSVKDLRRCIQRKIENIKWKIDKTHLLLLSCNNHIEGEVTAVGDSRTDAGEVTNPLKIKPFVCILPHLSLYISLHLITTPSSPDYNQEKGRNYLPLYDNKLVRCSTDYYSFTPTPNQKGGEILYQ